MLKECRLKRGFTQKELADRSGIPLSLIQKYEQGRLNIDLAKLETICALANALDCEISDVLNDKNLIKKFERTVFR